MPLTYVLIEHSTAQLSGACGVSCTYEHKTKVEINVVEEPNMQLLGDHCLTVQMQRRLN